MFCWLHFPKHGGDFTVRANDESGALCAHVGFPIHAFFHPDAVRLNDFLIRVAEQGERKIELLDELFVAFDGINTDPENMGFVGNFRPCVPNAACLRRATGRIVFGVEVQYHGSVAEARELDGGAGAIGAAYGWGAEIRG